ncbi:MAG TPA: prephenate dehydratase [bacterium]|nr:prephenate dehydratase [bacterium]HPN43709.1 prephenate dehydratase [bacterium]
MQNEPITTVAFQGARYAFSEIAAKQFFGATITCIPCKSFDNVFETVVNNQADFGIVPVENSLTGSIHRNYDLLLEHELLIVGEVRLRVEQHLIANPGITLDEIRTVYSHPQALEQCRLFLASLPNVEPVASYDTAGSVKMIRDNKIMNAAAIASRLAADTYQMQIIKEVIEDIPENFTRFLILAVADKKLGPADKTSIVFSMKNIPGALFKALSVFALRDIDLLKIESRPLRGKPWEYIFYLDFAGNMQQEGPQNAIRHLKEMTNLLKVLGSYPSGRSGENNK